MELIDLRSDTLTQPTPAMRQAMANAEVGDDVFREDPTVAKLEQITASILGKESALFVPSGTMGNLICLLTHCQRGDEYIVGDRSHIFLNEVGGASALGGLHPHVIPNEKDGTLPLSQLEKAFRPEDIHFPSTRLICLENTHNFCSGATLTPSYMNKVSQIAQKHNTAVHLDGARLFSAAVALDVPVTDLTGPVDSVMISISKGLSAPVGSLISSTGDFINQARKYRKMLGGGMRQAGHMAASGIVALESMIEHLKSDHANAYSFAKGISLIPGIKIDLNTIKTNIVFFELNHPKLDDKNFLAKLESRNIKILSIDPGVFRAVTHSGVKDHMIAKAVEGIKEILK